MRVDKMFVAWNGMKRINSHLEKDFCFVVSGKQFYCSRAQALFLSERVSNLLMTDKTAQFLHVNIECDEDAFENLINLSSGEQISEKANVKEMLRIAEYLGNEDFFELAEINKRDILNDQSQITIENVIDRLILKDNLSMDPESEMEFLAERFPDVSSICNILETIGHDLSSELLSRSDLRIIDEDWLLETILSCGDDYTDLLQFVECQYLSKQGISRYIENIHLEEINRGMWSSICKRLRHSSKAQDSKRAIKSLQKFIFDKNKPFDGIVKFVHDTLGESDISVTTSSPSWSKPKRLLNESTETFVDTLDEPNSWISLDFKDRTVSVTDYAIMSNTSYGARSVLREWALEGSNDNTHRVQIDSQKTHRLLLPSSFAAYHVQRRAESFRYIRIRQTGHASDNTHILLLTRFELFGYIISMNSTSRSAKF